jgi:nicotinate phosphoribosyltransferase
MPRERLPADLFDLPVDRIREGFYTDAYFNGSRRVLEEQRLHPAVTMQVFQKQEDALLCGVDEALAVLRLCAGSYAGEGEERRWQPGWDQLVVHALDDGDELQPWETVLTVRGDYGLFAHLETVYLGVLARRTLIASNVRRVVRAAAGKPVLYFPARFDLYATQAGDGYAAHVAGADGVSTQAQASWWGGEGMGTVPHALIAACGGDTVDAVRRFADVFYPAQNVTALVDFDNDCVATSLACARALGERLWAVRLDTSESIVDRSLWEGMGSFRPVGVPPELVRAVRRALDDEGFQRVRIVVSGGFDADRVRRFEAAGVPVDAYGVGSSLLRGSADFTADVVQLEGRPCAKVGRALRPNPRLRRVR